MTDISHLIQLCRSPVEKMFLSGFVGESGIAHLEYYFGDISIDPRDNALIVDGSNESIVIVPQWKTGTFTVDFAIAPIGSALTLAVEIDGHDWHERTKAQAQADRRRDRELLQRGAFPVRFTGSEVWADAALCVKETLETLERLSGRDDGLRQDGWTEHVAKTRELAEEERLP